MVVIAISLILQNNDIRFKEIITAIYYMRTMALIMILVILQIITILFYCNNGDSRYMAIITLPVIWNTDLNPRP